MPPIKLALLYFQLAVICSALVLLRLLLVRFIRILSLILSQYWFHSLSRNSAPGGTAQGSKITLLLRQSPLCFKNYRSPSFRNHNRHQMNQMQMFFQNY